MRGVIDNSFIYLATHTTAATSDMSITADLMPTIADIHVMPSLSDFIFINKTHGFEMDPSRTSLYIHAIHISPFTSYLYIWIYIILRTIADKLGL